MRKTHQAMKLVDESQTDDFWTDGWVLHNSKTIWEDAAPSFIALRRRLQPEPLVESKVFGDEARRSCKANPNQLWSMQQTLFPETYSERTRLPQT